jgi:hypothetical protein
MQFQRRNIAILITVLLTIILAAKSLYFTVNYGGTDLRCRIVGSRLTNTHKSPYSYKWNAADGERYLDPNDQRDRTINGNVATPAILYAINPLAQLPYKNIRLIWTIIQFAVIAISLWLLYKADKSTNLPSYLSPVIIIILSFVCSDLWLYNIERGQVYTLYVLFFSLIYWTYTKSWKFSRFLSGFISGVFVFFRPTAILFLAGFLIKRQYKFVAGALAGIVIGGALFVLPNLSHWKQYGRAMDDFSKYYTGHGVPVSSSPVEIPSIVEGTNNMTIYRDFTSGGMGTLYDYVSKVGIPLDTTKSIILFFVVIGLLSFFFLKGTAAEENSTDELFLFGFLLYILSEIFIIAPRAGYSVIQWIFPLFIGWKYIYGQRLLLSLFITGVLLLHHFPFLFPYVNDLAELSFILLLLFILFRPATVSVPANKLRS